MPPPDTRGGPEPPAGDKGSSEGVFPTFLLVGAPHSGVNTLAERLAVLSSVHLPQAEPRFFEDRFELGPRWYRSRFRPPTDARVVGDPSSTVLAADIDHELVAARIDGLLPGVRLVGVLRDPAERSALHHRELILTGRIPAEEPFEVFLRKAHGGDDPHGVLSSNLYGRHLLPFARRFRDRLLLIDHGALLEDPVDVLMDVAAHLQMPLTIDEYNLVEGHVTHDGRAHPLSREARRIVASHAAEDLDLLRDTTGFDLAARHEPDTPPRSRSTALHEVVLHIGLHKTGTTTIQQFFKLNEVPLRASASVDYLSVGLGNGAGHHNLAWELVEPEGRFDRGRGGWDEATARITSSPYEKVLVSSEEFDRLDEQQISDIAKHLAPFDVTVVLLLRNQVDLALSLYRQGAKQRKMPDVLEFCARLSENDPRFDFQALVHRWASIFGMERMIVQPYEDVVDGLIEGFCAMIGIDSPGRLIEEWSERKFNESPQTGEALPASDVAAILEKYADSNRMVHQEICPLPPEYFPEDVSGPRRV